jgi:hypothetical protein
VAGCDDGDRVAAVGGTDGADRLGHTDLAGDLGVGAGFAERNGQQGCPDFLLEFGAGEIELEVERPSPVGEIFGELPLGLDQDWVVRIFADDIEAISFSAPTGVGAILKT